MIDLICGILGIAWDASAPWAGIVVASGCIIAVLSALFIFLFFATIMRRLTRFGYKWSVRGR